MKVYESLIFNNLERIWNIYLFMRLYLWLFTNRYLQYGL